MQEAHSDDNISQVFAAHTQSDHVWRVRYKGDSPEELNPRTSQATPMIQSNARGYRNVFSAQSLEGFIGAGGRRQLWGADSVNSWLSIDDFDSAKILTSENSSLEVGVCLVADEFDGLHTMIKDSTYHIFDTNDFLVRSSLRSLVNLVFTDGSDFAGLRLLINARRGRNKKALPWVGRFVVLGANYEYMPPTEWLCESKSWCWYT